MSINLKFVKNLLFCLLKLKNNVRLLFRFLCATFIAVPLSTFSAEKKLPLLLAKEHNFPLSGNSAGGGGGCWRLRLGLVGRGLLHGTDGEREREREREREGGVGGGRANFMICSIK